MKNIYSIFRLASKVKSPRVKRLGVWALHIMRRRYLGIFLDPVVACNLRCKMCYFSDPEWRRDQQRPPMPVADIEALAKALFHRALKLQIGCGAEPTVYTDLLRIVELGSRYRVPYISITTNGNLLTRESLRALAAAGLNELTLSAHGFTADTYEQLMERGRFDRFLSLLADVAEVKKEFPELKLRINFTVNNLNIADLAKIWEVPCMAPDILQLRPIQKLAETEYHDFDLTRLHDLYDTCFKPVIAECERRGITCISPTRENIATLMSDTEGDESIDSAYCYASPNGVFKKQFRYHDETFEQFSQRTHRGRMLFANIFAPKHHKKNRTRKMNYNVK